MERVETRKFMVSLERLNMDFGWSRAFASVRMYVGEVLCACGDIILLKIYIVTVLASHIHFY